MGALRASAPAWIWILIVVPLLLVRRARTAFVIFSLAWLWATSASAGTITGATMFGINAGTGPGLGTVSVPAIVTVTANNDDVPASDVLDSNIIVPIKRFDNNGFIDIEFSVAATAGVTEYLVFESVDNNTGVNWNGYQMYLGFGVGAAFVPSPGGDGLDFDAPLFTTAPTSSVMPIVALGEDSLLWSGGVQGAGAESYQFRLDVPDLSPFPGVGTFTIRQIPIAVPEPSSVALAAFAFVSLAAWDWRRRRSRRVAQSACDRKRR